MGSLSAEARLGPAHLQVADLDRAVTFYTDTLGFAVLRREGSTATLTTDGATESLTLREIPGARPRPPRTTGLYHVAILTPSRAALARSLRRLVEARYPLSGVADHLVSEALYLNDPDGNGLEIYRDRPRAEWQYVNGEVAMATDPLDVEALLREGLADEHPWTGLEPDTRVGHMHLQVADLDAATAFYRDVVGFDLMLRFGRQAAFLSVGGYHHHLGLNTWGTLSAPPAPANAAGLRAFEVIVPGAADLEALRERLRAAGVAFDERDGVVIARDPSQNEVWARAAA